MKETSIKVKEDLALRLNRLKYYWQLKSLDAVIRRLIEIASKIDTANSLFNLNKGAGLAFGDSKDHPASLRAACPSSTQTDDKKTKQEKGGEK